MTHTNTTINENIEFVLVYMYIFIITAVIIILLLAIHRQTILSFKIYEEISLINNNDLKIKMFEEEYLFKKSYK